MDDGLLAGRCVGSAVCLAIACYFTPHAILITPFAISLMGDSSSAMGTVQLSTSYTTIISLLCVCVCVCVCFHRQRVIYGAAYILSFICSLCVLLYVSATYLQSLLLTSGPVWTFLQPVYLYTLHVADDYPGFNVYWYMVCGNTERVCCVCVLVSYPV